MIYTMSKTETRDWNVNRKVDHKTGSNYATVRIYCRELISDIAIERGCHKIADDSGKIIS